MTDFFSNDQKTGGLKGHTILCFDPWACWAKSSLRGALLSRSELSIRAFQSADEANTLDRAREIKIE
jgi:hypothetical protein